MIKPKNELSPKHLQALELIRSGEYSYREVAQKVGWSEGHLYHLIAGDTSTEGNSAVLFSAEVDKITADLAKDVKHLSKKVQKNIFAVFEEWSQTLKTTKITPSKLSTAVSIMNAIGKVTPKIEIGSFSYTQGLSLEDIRNEYRRIRGILSDTRGIRSALEGRSGESAGGGEQGSTSS
jgi:hypothetical protein